MGKIFINYRREDSRGEARGLFDRLSARFPGQVFMDVSVLDPGVDFVQAIDDEVGSCDAFVVVIGKGWLSITNASGQRRLDDAQDFVRLEIATALKRKIAVVPALVGGATMPTAADLPPDLQGLTRRNALYLTDQGWDDDVNRLVRALERTIPDAKKQKQKGKSARRPLRWLAVAGMLAVILLVVEFGPRFSPRAHQGSSEVIAPSSGFTHSVRVGDLILDYQSSTGLNKVRRIGWFGHTQDSGAIPNFSSGWTSIVPISNDILFYNRDTGSTAVGKLNEDATFEDLRDSSLPRGWTSIVNTPNGVFFYNKNDGSAEVGRFDGTTGNYTAIKPYSPGAFRTGWTVMYGDKGLEFHESDNPKAGIFGEIKSSGDFSPKTPAE
jgi:hypothetical protein